MEQVAKKTNSLTKASSRAVAPETSILDVMAAFANSSNGGGFEGSRLKFSKGEFFAGDNQEEVEIGTRFLADIRSTEHGSVVWVNNRPDASNMVNLLSGEIPKPRSALGFDDRSQWELDMNNQPRDPVQATMSLDFYPVDLGRPTTRADRLHFSTTSVGGMNAIKKLIGEYVQHARMNGGDKCKLSPVVELRVSSYQHSNKAYGRIKNPEFKIVEWVPTE